MTKYQSIKIIAYGTPEEMEILARSGILKSFNLLKLHHIWNMLTDPKYTQKTLPFFWGIRVKTQRNLYKAKSLSFYIMLNKDSSIS